MDRLVSADALELTADKPEEERRMVAITGRTGSVCAVRAEYLVVSAVDALDPPPSETLEEMDQ